MTIVVIGADNVSHLREEAARHGFHRLHHLDGRKSRDVKHPLPHDTTVVLIVTDSVNHNLMHKVKRAARAGGIPVLYAGRSASQLSRTLSGVLARQLPVPIPVRTPVPDATPIT
jgi:hypothetical protein